MTKSDNSHADAALGMRAGITRRDFINSTLIGSGGVLITSLAPAQLFAGRPDWDGYGGVGDYSNSNGNTAAVVADGHQIRDQIFDPLAAGAVETSETYDCIIVGGGISGLAAALFLNRLGGDRLTSLVLDNHAIFGGEAKRNEFLVDGQRLIVHQGSAFLPAPMPYSFIGRFYESIGVDWRKFMYQNWGSRDPEMPLATTPYTESPENYGLYFGAKFGRTPGLWMVNPWEQKLRGAPISAQERSELLKYATTQPARRKPAHEGDDVSRYLDSITLEQDIMNAYGISRETVRKFLSPVEGGGSGLGPDVLSAYCDYAADLLHPLPIGDAGAQMFPGGNTGFARHMTKALIPDSIAGAETLESVCRNPVNFAALDRPHQKTRIRLRSTVVAVQHSGPADKSEFVSVVYTREGRVYRTRARSVIMAGGSWTTKHIVRDLPGNLRDAYGQFHRSACLMANVAVRNWRFLYKLGVTGCRWFEGLGNYLAVRKLATFGSSSPEFGPDSPTVLTMKVLFSYPGLPIEIQGERGRTELFSTAFSTYERQIRQQFTDMFSRFGFDARRDIAGIILNRWGHAYLNPQPGFFFGAGGNPAPSSILRAAPFGRIAFANTDLAGIMDHRCSILEAHRAVSQLVDQVLV
jgi:spermidine dehydrogenase